MSNNQSEMQYRTPSPLPHQMGSPKCPPTPTTIRTRPLCNRELLHKCVPLVEKKEWIETISNTSPRKQSEGSVTADSMETQFPNTLDPHMDAYGILDTQEHPPRHLFSPLFKDISHPDHPSPIQSSLILPSCVHLAQSSTATFSEWKLINQDENPFLNTDTAFNRECSSIHTRSSLAAYSTENQPLKPTNQSRPKQKGASRSNIAIRRLLGRHVDSDTSWSTRLRPRVNRHILS
ncbi:hypothetical protein F4703DRAFT_1820117 [Phycomyces blakesleeanus]